MKLIDEKRKIVNVCYLVDSGLNALKDNHRLLLELRYVYQKTIQEISATHGIPMRTLYRKLEDALTRFQVELSRMGFDEEFLEKEYSSSPFISKIHNAVDTEKFNTAYK
ncbi:MAG: sigma-70 family RNA polymerase sigma factor [Clostridia bacterium]|nr:sigma-70 family RNA polymerase sigma factor [Clostridia bacterium]